VGIFKMPIDQVRSGSLSSYGKHLHRQKLRFFIQKAFRYLMLACAAGALLFLIMVVQISTQLPDVDIISTYVPNETTKVYAADGSILAELHQEENRVIVPISQISDFVKAAVIASEDTNFYRHNGLDFSGLFRSVFVNIVRGEKMQGGSTITMQLARSIFLNKRKKMIRKIAEMILALQLERKYTKEEILEFYLNQVYWGRLRHRVRLQSLLRQIRRRVKSAGGRDLDRSFARAGIVFTVHPSAAGALAPGHSLAPPARAKSDYRGRIPSGQRSADFSGLAAHFALPASVFYQLRGQAADRYVRQ